METRNHRARAASTVTAVRETDRTQRRGGRRPVRAWFVAAAAAAALPLVPIASVNAEPGGASIAVRYTGTLAKINDSGAIRIGHRENSPPFAFRDAAGKPIGYSLDICDIVIEEIAGELGKDIRVTYRAVTPENRFDVVCAPCHGLSGDGDGMIVQRGFARPPSYHLERLRAAPAGHFFDVITNGLGTMYPYGYRVPPRDRWAITAYIRALQLSRQASITDVPRAEREKLQRPSR